MAAGREISGDPRRGSRGLEDCRKLNYEAWTASGHVRRTAVLGRAKAGRRASDNTAAVPRGKPRDQLVLPVTARKPGADRAFAVSVEIRSKIEDRKRRIAGPSPQCPHLFYTEAPNFEKLIAERRGTGSGLLQSRARRGTAGAVVTECIADVELCQEISLWS
ncbi:hypothetical protein VTG60DRAFT_5108 [Thermothelomyces hinnuleus]